jgi:bifunctional oligoribonuclease and PAP phosphatase NrnA
MFTKIKETVDGGSRFLVTTHIDPDGDAIGSVLAVYYALKALRKEISIYLTDEIPYQYQFLPHPDNILRRIPDEGFDAIFVVDCGNFFRVGEGYEKLKGKGTIINVDHHDTNEAFGNINILDERASSTAAILYLIFNALKVPFNYEIAVSLYTAVLTDTGSFRYENTDSRSFLVCEEMTRYGVKPAVVAANVYESHPKERLLLLRLVLETMTTYYDDRLALVFVTEEMFRKTHTNREYTEGFVELLKEIKTVEVAALAREISPQRFKISMRARGTVDVAGVAVRFGGGGHKSAAGCFLEGSQDVVRNRLVGAFNL